jgi:hypothetical protein
MLGTPPKSPWILKSVLELRLIWVECGRRFVALRVVLSRRFCPLFYHLVRTSNTSVLIVPIPRLEHVPFFEIADLKADLGWQSIDVDMGLVKSTPWEKHLSRPPTNDHASPHPPSQPPNNPPQLNNLLFVWDSPSHTPPSYLFICLLRGFCVV